MKKNRVIMCASLQPPVRSLRITWGKMERTCKGVNSSEGHYGDLMGLCAPDTPTLSPYHLRHHSACDDTVVLIHTSLRNAFPPHCQQTTLEIEMWGNELWEIQKLKAISVTHCSLMASL